MPAEPFLHVLLYQPLIPQNTGNIGRLCACTRTRLHLVKPLGFSLDEKAVRRAGLDYWPLLDLEIHERWSPADCPGRCHLFTRQAQRSCFDITFERGDWLVFGPEDVGLPAGMLAEHHDQALRLPIFGAVRSLNLANAVSAAVYLALKDCGAAERNP